MYFNSSELKDLNSDDNSDNNLDNNSEDNSEDNSDDNSDNDLYNNLDNDSDNDSSDYESDHNKKSKNKSSKNEYNAKDELKINVENKTEKVVLTLDNEKIQCDKSLLKTDGDVTNIRNILFGHINENFGYGKYGEFDVVMMKKNGYINATKLCEDISKKIGKKINFKEWIKTEQAEELMEYIISSGESSNVLIKVKHEKNNDIKGTYADPCLIPHLITWASPKHGIKHFRMIREKIINESIKEKNIPKSTQDELSNTQEKLLNTKCELLNTKCELIKTKDELIKTKDELINILNKLISTSRDLKLKKIKKCTK